MSLVSVSINKSESVCPNADGHDRVLANNKNDTLRLQMHLSLCEIRMYDQIYAAAFFLPIKELTDAERHA